MKSQNYFLVWAVLFGFLSFISCTNDSIMDDVPQLDNLSGETQKELVGIPYAKENELQAFSSDNEIVGYNGYMPYYMNTHAILGKDFVTLTLYRK